MSRALSTNQIRRMFLDFFASKQHLILASHSTIASDPTTMFVVAGMQPFKPQFMGAEAVFDGQASKRVTSAQKCVRLNDVENVGRTLRHLSLFEMMGNFSFGDYFKRDAIHWAWEFLTSPEWLGMEKDRIYVTVYKEDDEAFNYWHKELGLPDNHIHRFDADENFWPANAPLEGPNGPCGPCSEIYYDRGPSYGNDTWADYATTRESARFLEIWNLVFPQYERQDLDNEGQPVLKELPYKNIDTGMGLERVASIVQDVPDFYSNDVFLPIIHKIQEITGHNYQGQSSVSHRVIAEHIRSVSIVIADGTLPDKNKAGYVVRKVLRRAIRHFYKLGVKEPKLYSLVPLVVEKMGEAYPELVEQQQQVIQIIQREEESFLRTLAGGIERLSKLLDEQSGDQLSGQEAFTLYDTYGFPLELTQEIAEEHGISVDVAGYNNALATAQELARPKEKAKLFDADQQLLEGIPATAFCGYDNLQTEAKVLAIVQDGQIVDIAQAHTSALVVLSQTSFYAEGGGEVGDTGRLEWQGGEAKVIDTTKTPSGVFLHQVEVVTGELGKDASLKCVVSEKRLAIQRHHTATHLLHAALRAVLGSGVAQKGSLVAADRLRFDFSHTAALTTTELATVEQLVSRWVSANFAVSCREMPLAEAKAAGATALFGEKYGESVRVVKVEGDVQHDGHSVASMELCGGAHVTSTGEIGAFVLLSDENVAAGVRRIEALAGEAASHWLRAQLTASAEAAALLNTNTANLGERITGLQNQLRAADKEISALKAALAEAQMSGATAADNQLQQLGGYAVASLQLTGIAGNELRGAADKLLESSGADIVVIASDKGLVVKASKDAVGKGAHAGKLIGKLAAAGGGKGGGRPDMAQAGISDADAALAALETAFGENA